MQNDEHENAKVKEDEEEGSNDANNGNDVAKDEYAEGGGMNSLPPYPLHSTTTAEANDSETHHVHLNNNSIDDGDGDGDGDGDEVYINQHQHQQSEQQQQQQEQHEDHLLPEYNHETMSTIPSSSSSSSRYRALNDKWDKTMDGKFCIVVSHSISIYFSCLQLQLQLQLTCSLLLKYNISINQHQQSQ